MGDAGALTIAAMRRAITRQLTSAGLETPDIDSRRLLELATGLTAEALLREPDRIVTAAELCKLESYTARRLHHEPISRIAGYRDFFGRRFHVSPATLDPRPETETLVAWVLDWVRRQGFERRPLRILDIGTGTGCILLTLLAELPEAEGVGTDISDAALVVAAGNASALALTAQSVFINRKGLAGVLGPFDIVVSNPPYIASGLIAGLAPEVRAFDPMRALDGGEDGLHVYSQIAARISEVLPKGLLALEVGYDQASDVALLFRKKLGQAVAAQHIVPDLGGHNRCVVFELHNA